MRAATLYLRSAEKSCAPISGNIDANVRIQKFAAATEQIEIRLLSGVAVVAGVLRKLSAADYAILSELAQEQRWYDSAEIIEDLYPELDSVTAANRLYVATHRLRKRIHCDVVIGGSCGYRVGHSATVDLVEAETLIRKGAAERQLLTMKELERVQQLLPLVRAELIALSARARLRSGVEFRLTETRRRLLAAGAASACKAGYVALSLQFSEALIADDECDEDGNFYRIRGLLRTYGIEAAEEAWKGYRRALVYAKYPEPPSFCAIIEEQSVLPA